MKEFFAENWKFIVYIVFAILGIVITLCKKTKVVSKTVDTPFERVMALLPSLIVEAEKSGMKGESKLNSVVFAALGILQKLCQRDLSFEEIDDYRDAIIKAIEQILETPQKKGVVYGNNEEKKN